MAYETQSTLELGSREVVRFIAERGYKHVFGLPGSSMVSALYELQGHPIEYVPAIHESVAVAMADGYARVSGSGLAMIYMMPGTANALTGLYNAWHDESPLIVIASQQASQLRSIQGTIGEADQVAAARPFTRLSHEITGGMNVRFWLEAAWRASQGSPSGPAFLSITEDAFEAPGPVTQLRMSERIKSAPQSIDRLVSELLKAERPAIVVGGQLQRAGGAKTIETLATEFDIPIAYENGFQSRLGAAPGHSHVFGSVLLGGRELEQNADCVIMLGARNMLDGHPRPQWFPRAQFIAQINADPARLEETHTADWVAACDPALLAEALLTRLRQASINSANRAKFSAWLNTLRNVSSGGPYESMVGPARAATAHLHDALDRGWVVDESVTSSTALISALKSLDGRRYIGCSGAALGWGTGAAVGVALASGEPVTCVLGDGALRFGCAGLWSIRAANLPITLVVLDNGGYGSTRFFERQYIARLGKDASYQGPSYFGSDLRNKGPSVKQVIEGYGIQCRQVGENDNPREAVDAAWETSHRGPNAVVIPMPF